MTMKTYIQKSACNIGLCMRKKICGALFIFIIVNSSIVHACSLINDITWYFGWDQDIYDQDFILDAAVSSSIKRTKTTTFEEEPIIYEHHLFYLRNGMLYVKGVPTELIDGSFKYLGNGYFRLRGRIYYRGTPEADYPTGSIVKTWNYAHDDPPPDRQDGPPILASPCPKYVRPIFVLESSAGLHIEHEERPGHSTFPSGMTCKEWTGHTCAELRRMGAFDDSRYRVDE
jgi:hypothetical protein